MKNLNRFAYDLLDLEQSAHTGDLLWRPGPPTAVLAGAEGVRLSVPFTAYTCQAGDAKFQQVKDLAPRSHQLLVRAYGDSILRISADFAGVLPADANNPMLEMAADLCQVPLTVQAIADGWQVHDAQGRLRLELKTTQRPIQHWSDLLAAPAIGFVATVYPDGITALPFMDSDTFFPTQVESVPLGYVSGPDGVATRALFSLHARPDEKFAGTGERFARMDLAGSTLVLENMDGLGVNNRRCYKNVPFYLSSRGYGVLLLTSAHLRLSLADVSTRASQALVEQGAIDLVLFGGAGAANPLERILCDYRRLTGFPHDVPRWSYGTWMSRMTYFSDAETRGIASRLRDEKFPCDVLHLDTGWFRKDWKCEWEFSPERFPDPAGYMAWMGEHGYRISLWQYPRVSSGTKHFEQATREGWITRQTDAVGGSNFSDSIQYEGHIDFTNPAAVQWYQGLIADLIRLGAKVIKTDFGEDIDMNARYAGMPAQLLHNLYGVLYQKAAFEITDKLTGEPLIWARAGWTGAQRYPIHWGGDCACSWDGLAGSLRGGLHLGLSGFAFWSHDVPGFHGLPDFMNHRPSDALYLRWTQFGVFSSHLRYHGTSAREPYEYPAVADTVRGWLNLRYALIPYLMAQGAKAVRSGFPILRALVLHDARDPQCWGISDQFLCGDDLLVAPVMNDEGVRDVYLPAGEWVDLWSGIKETGGRWLRDVRSPLERIPVFVRHGARLPVYPEVVQCTDEMDMAKVLTLSVDDSYRGLAASVLGRMSGLE